MRATATVLFIAGLAGTALGAATKMYDDENWYVPRSIGHLSTA
jgi:hypothetical protein